jgi:hypothetical protein
VSRRWIECRVCGESRSPRAPKQDVCGLKCFCRDRRHLVGLADAAAASTAAGTRKAA